MKLRMGSPKIATRIVKHEPCWLHDVQVLYTVVQVAYEGVSAVGTVEECGADAGIIRQRLANEGEPILTTNLAACVCAKCDPFLPLRSHFFFKRPENFVRIAKFPYAAFGPLFAFHCPIFFTKNNTLNGVCMLNVTAAH